MADQKLRRQIHSICQTVQAARDRITKLQGELKDLERNSPANSAAIEKKRNEIETLKGELAGALQQAALDLQTPPTIADSLCSAVRRL